MSSRGSFCFLRLALIIAAVASLGRGAPSAQSTPPLLYGLTPIGQLGGSQSAAYDVTDFAQVIVGRAKRRSGAYHAFAEGLFGRRDLGTLGGGDSTAFWRVDLHSSWGRRRPPAVRYPRVFAYNPGTSVMTDLGTLGGTWSAAYDVNDLSVVGASKIAGDSRLMAFHRQFGVITPLRSTSAATAPPAASTPRRPSLAMPARPATHRAVHSCC